jgi:hypothetical protein
MNGLPHFYTMPSVAKSIISNQLHSKASGCSYPNLMVNMKVCFCLQIVELTHMRLKDVHMQRYADFTKANLEHEWNSVSLPFPK